MALRYRSWDKNGVNLQELIDEIKKYPMIYDFTMAEQCQKIPIENAWTEISNRLGYPAILCRERWRKIRTAFNRSLKENARSSKKKPYYLHNKLKFLIPHMKIHSVTEPETNTDYNSDSSGEGRLQIVEDVPENENNNVSNNAVGTDEVANNGKVPIAEFGTERDDSRRMFLMSLLSDVNQLTDYEMTLFKKKTLNVIEGLISIRNNI